MEGPLGPRLGCSMSKGEVKPISNSMDARADKQLFRLYLDLEGGGLQLRSIGEN